MKLPASQRRWSQRVTQTSNTLELEPGVFTWRDPNAIARSLAESAESSTRSTSRSPFQSAMSMLSFYMNRAGKKLPMVQRVILMKAKQELRKLYHRS